MGLCLSNNANNNNVSNSTNKPQAAQTPAKKEEPKKKPSQPDLVLTPEPPTSHHESFSPEKNIQTTKTQSEDDMPVFTGATQRAGFGAGCYWGTEKYFRYNFQKKYPKLGKITQGAVGFMGPESAPANPTYREVCSGETGHVEVYDFEFQGGAEYYERLVKFFFQFHDPTTANRQGNDRGTQYASVIYCYNDEQFEIATRVKKELQHLLKTNKLGKVYQGTTVTTAILKSTTFYSAHEEHQDYLTINPNGYCNHRMRFSEWPKDEGTD